MNKLIAAAITLFAVQPVFANESWMEINPLTYKTYDFADETFTGVEKSAAFNLELAGHFGLRASVSQIDANHEDFESLDLSIRNVKVGPMVFIPLSSGNLFYTGFIHHRLNVTVKSEFGNDSGHDTSNYGLFGYKADTSMGTLYGELELNDEYRLATVGYLKDIRDNIAVGVTGSYEMYDEEVGDDTSIMGLGFTIRFHN